MEAQYRILFVDDEQDITSIVKRGLEKQGNKFVVDTFNDPLKALDQFAAGKYDLAILDIKMPNMTGFDLYRELVKKDPEIKICFLSAFVIYREEFKRMFPSLKVGNFVSKPIKIADLARIVQEELSSKP